MFADNHAAEAIPKSELVSGWKVAQISIGVAITLPAFLVAAETFSAVGLVDGLLSLAIAGVILFCVASATMVVGAKTRASTYTIISSVFGRRAALGVNLVIALVLLGWFAVTVSIFASALLGSLSSLAKVSMPLWTAKALGGVLMTLVTLYGFRAIDRLSGIMVPLLACMLIAAFAVSAIGADFSALMQSKGDREQIKSVGTAVSILVGAFMVGVTIVPDMARFLRSPKHGVAASAMSYGFGSQLVFVFSGIPALITGEKDFVANLLVIGFGWPALFIVIFATLTTNVNNLYSTSLSLRQVLPRLPDFQMTILAGSIGTAIALSGIENAFIPFLVFLSIAIPPIAGVYTAHVFSRGAAETFSAGKNWVWPAILSWLLGALTALATTNGWIALSHIPAIDGFLSSALVFYVAQKVFMRRSS